MNRKLYMMISLIVCFAAHINAQDSFSSIINTIVSTSPSLQSERQLAEARRLQSADENSLANPEVEFARVWGRNGIGNKLQLDVSQSFDWPGLYSARKKANQQAYVASQMLLASSSLDLSLEAKQLLLQLVYIRQTIDLTKQLKDNLDALTKAMDASYKQGNVTELDRRKIAIEEYKLNTEYADWQNKESEVICALMALSPNANIDFSSIREYPIERTVSESEYLGQVSKCDPLIAANSISIEEETYNAKAANMSRFPSFSVGYQHQAEMGDRFNGFTVGMSLPFFQNRHARRAALDRRLAADVTNHSLLAQKKAQVQNQYKTMVKLREQVDAYQQAFGDNTYLKLLKKAYQGGEIDILTYLTEVQYFHEATHIYLEADYNYRQCLAILNKYSLIENNQ